MISIFPYSVEFFDIYFLFMKENEKKMFRNFGDLSINTITKKLYIKKLLFVYG